MEDFKVYTAVFKYGMSCFVLRNTACTENQARELFKSKLGLPYLPLNQRGGYYVGFGFAESWSDDTYRITMAPTSETEAVWVMIKIPNDEPLFQNLNWLSGESAKAKAYAANNAVNNKHIICSICGMDTYIHSGLPVCTHCGNLNT